MQDRDVHETFTRSSSLNSSLVYKEMQSMIMLLENPIAHGDSAVLLNLVSFR